MINYARIIDGVAIDVSTDPGVSEILCSGIT